MAQGTLGGSCPRETPSPETPSSSRAPPTCRLVLTPSPRPDHPLWSEHLLPPPTWPPRPPILHAAPRLPWTCWLDHLPPAGSPAVASTALKVEGSPQPLRLPAHLAYHGTAPLMRAGHFLSSVPTPFPLSLQLEDLQLEDLSCRGLARTPSPPPRGPLRAGARTPNPRCLGQQGPRH